MQETLVQFLGQEDPLEKGQATHSSILGLPCGSADKEATCSAGDLGSIPGLGRSTGLENSMDLLVYGVTKRQTRLSEFRFHEWPGAAEYQGRMDLSSVWRAAAVAQCLLLTPRQPVLG